MGIWDTIVKWDYEIWYYMNTVWHNDVLDAIVPYLRNQWTWAPLYLFLLLFMTMNFGRRGWMWCVFFLLTFSLSDYISASIIKPYFHRIRPCNNPYLAQLVHNIVPCGGGYSFPSSHAANHFSLGVFSAITLQRHVKGVWYMAMAWAILVSYSQVYVGVHFPLDVTCGGLLGIIIACITSAVFNKIYNLSQPDKKKVIISES